jgi:hypothetical protein
MDSSYSDQYLQFRDASLSLLELDNIRARVKMLIQDGKSGYLVSTLGPWQRRVKLHLHISRRLNRLSFLGAHFVRLGDPRLNFQKQVEEQLTLIAQEEAHGHQSEER